MLRSQSYPRALMASGGCTSCPSCRALPTPPASTPPSPPPYGRPSKAPSLETYSDYESEFSDNGLNEVEGYIIEADDEHTHVPAQPFPHSHGHDFESTTHLRVHSVHSHHSHSRGSFSSNPDLLSDSSDYSPPKSSRMSLTALLRSFFYSYIVPRLPVELQEVAHHPPNLQDPSSLVPLIKAVAPYTQFILLLLGVYIVWAFVTGFIGYIARFVRFCFRIGPVIAIIAWIMAASGQGGIDVLFEALKQYAGLGENAPAAGNQRRPAAHGHEFRDQTHNRRRRPTKPGKNDWSKWDARSATGSQRGPKKNKADPANGNPLPGAELISTLFGAAQQAQQDGFGGQVQDFVRQAVGRATGLDWLFSSSNNNNNKDDERKRR